MCNDHMAKHPQSRNSPPCAPLERSLRWMLLSRSRSSRTMCRSARLRRSLPPHQYLYLGSLIAAPSLAAAAALSIDAAQVCII